MRTVILKPDTAGIETAAQHIKSGGLVAFPTETVYGLGANALDAEAAKKIYEAKGRPSDNPLIVHISSKDQIKAVAAEVPIKARIVISHFMPGAVTIVLKKKAGIPDVVTGGLGTVAVRMPSNKTALEFIKAAGVPIAAPSANKSGSPSPTSAEHVYSDLNGRIGYIIDGGRSSIGVESTILDFTGAVPVLLRAGGVTLEEVESVIGKIEVNTGGGKALAPGMKYKHYSPKADVYFSSYHKNMPMSVKSYYDALKLEGRNPVILCVSQNVPIYKERSAMDMGKNYREYAKNLYAALRDADKLGYDSVIAEGVEPKGIGATIINRLIKSSGGKII